MRNITERIPTEWIRPLEWHAKCTRWQTGASKPSYHCAAPGYMMFKHEVGKVSPNCNIYIFVWVSAFLKWVGMKYGLIGPPSKAPGKFAKVTGGFERPSFTHLSEDAPLSVAIQVEVCKSMTKIGRRKCLSYRICIHIGMTRIILNMTLSRRYWFDLRLRRITWDMKS